MAPCDCDQALGLSKPLPALYDGKASHALLFLHLEDKVTTTETVLSLTSVGLGEVRHGQVSASKAMCAVPSVHLILVRDSKRAW